MTSRAIRVIGVVLVMIALSAPGATAEPPADVGDTGSSAPPGEDEMVLPLSDFGGSDRVQFDLTRNYATTVVSFPVPRGFTPVRLKGRIEFPIKIRYGNLTVRQGDRTISRIGLPTEDQADVVLPLAGVTVVGGSVNLSISLTVLPPDGFCWDIPPSLTDGAIAFTGTDEPPATVAEFLPSVLRRVTIAIPAKPSRSESEAAIQLATAVGVHRLQTPEVAIVPMPDGVTTPPDPARPLERLIVVKEDASKGVSLQGRQGPRSLLVSGSGEDLTGQARLFNNEWSEYAISASVGAEALPGEQDSLEDDTTLGEMNTNGLSSQRLQPEVVIYIDQTRFGHPLGGIRVHLIGSHTPVPADLGGEVVASVDGQAVDRWVAESTGAIDRTLVIPDRLVKRVTNLSVKLLTSASSGRCDDHILMALRLDPQTAIHVSASRPFAPVGFQSFPQALGRHLHIGIGADAFGDTARAAVIAVGLRRTSRVPLITEVTGLREAIDSPDSAVLVSGAEAVADPQIPLAFSDEQSRITVTGLDTAGRPLTFAVDPDVPFAALQATTSGDRSILVAYSNGVPGRLDDLLRWATGQPGRWGGLDGRAIVSVAGRDPIIVANPPADFSRAPDGEGRSGRAWLGWSIAAVAGAAVIVVAGAVVSRRRRR